jgi:hypothetical protein
VNPAGRLEPPNDENAPPAAAPAGRGARFDLRVGCAPFEAEAAALAARPTGKTPARARAVSDAMEEVERMLGGVGF